MTDRQKMNQESTVNERSYLRQRRLRYLRNRIRRINLERLNRLLYKYYDRLQKRVQRYLIAHPTRKKRPVFVLGSNRSGTQMVNRAIGRSQHGWEYPESNSWAFNLFYLRSQWIIKFLIRQSPAPLVSFGSISDSQFGNELLSTYENARIIWVYRRYQDAANSSVHRFGSHHKDLVRWVARGELERLGARGKNLKQETVATVKRLFHEEISDEEGSCLYWYMRNRLYFDLGLDEDPRVYLVQYEAAVQNPNEEFRKIFAFLGFPYAPEIIEGIFASSVGKHPWPGINLHIQEVCELLLEELHLSYLKQGGDPDQNRIYLSGLVNHPITRQASTRLAP